LYVTAYSAQKNKAKITQGNAMIARVDKGKTTVILYTQDYTRKSIPSFQKTNSAHSQKPHLQRP